MALTLAPTFWALPPALGAESGVALDPVHHGSPCFTMVHPGNCALDKSGPMKRAIDSKHSKVNGPIFLRMTPKSPNILNESHVFRGGRCAPRGHFCVKRDESRLLVGRKLRLEKRLLAKGQQKHPIVPWSEL